MKTGLSESRTRLRAVVVAVVGFVVAVAGCGTTATPAGASTDVATVSAGSTEPNVSYGWFAYGGPQATDASGGPIGTPVDAVERSGIVLPRGAVVTRVESHAQRTMAESYLFVFDIDAATASDFCEQDGLGGARKARTLAPDVATEMGSPRLTSESRGCEGRSPKNPQWTRYVLIDAGEPATVHLLLRRAA